MKDLRTIPHCIGRLKRSARMWWKQSHSDEAASLAFYSMISLVPILIVGVSIAAWIVGEETARQGVIDGTRNIAGSRISSYFAEILNSDTNYAGSKISPILSGLFLVYSATKVIAKLRKSLGKIFGARKHQGKKAAIATAVNRMIGVLLLFFLGLFIACAVVVETILIVVVHSLEDSPMLLDLISYTVPLFSFAALVLLSSVAMRWLPQRPPNFKQALSGGVVSALLLMLLKFGLTTFLNYADVGSIYGSAITLVVVLFYIYFAMQVFLYGAEYAAEVAREQRQKLAEAAKEVSTMSAKVESEIISTAPSQAPAPTFDTGTDNG